MPCALTQGFNLDCKDYVGGIKTVYIMEFENIVSLVTNTTVGNGSITTLATSTSVTGTGTSFLSQVKINDKIYQGATLLGTVASITSDTVLILVANAAAAVTGAAYTIQSSSPNSGTITNITKATGKFFRQYNLVKLTGMAEEVIQVNEENGTVFVQQTVKFIANKLQASVRNEIILLAKNRLAMVIVDNNGLGWLYGQTGAMQMNTGSKAQTGVKLGDRNGYELDFIGFEPALANQVDANTLATLQTPG